ASGGASADAGRPIGAEASETAREHDYRARGTMPVVRADLRDLLLAAGTSEEDIARAEREGWLPLLTLDRLVNPGRPIHDGAEVAAITGYDEERLRRLWRAFGFPDVPEGLAVFSDTDVEAARRLLGGGLARGW